MNSLVVYSSRTGNTAWVARAIFDILPAFKEIYPVQTAPPADLFDFVAVGFWVDKGRPDEAAARYMRTLRDATVGLFGTLGAPPDSDHAGACMAHAVEMVAGNQVAGTFLCQGRIDPKVVAVMQKTAAGIHAMTPERLERIRAAESHPDEADLRNARAAFRKMIQTVGEKGVIWAE